MSDSMNMQITEKKDSMNSQKTLQRLLYSDYDVPCFTFAKNLLGLLLCRRLETGEVVKGTIIETECYPGGIDKASLSFEGKKTERNAPMFMSPGTAFVYLTYGMYHCFNISSQGDGAAVLLRAVEPKYGIEAMRKNRVKSYKGKSSARKKPFTNLDLCSGPSKLCMSFAIDRSLNKEDMVESDKLWLEWPSDKSHCLNEDKQIVACARIGIDSVGKEWASKPFRFYLYGNPYVSKRDKKAEQSFAANVSS